MAGERPGAKAIVHGVGRRWWAVTASLVSVGSVVGAVVTDWHWWPWLIVGARLSDLVAVHSA